MAFMYKFAHYSILRRKRRGINPKRFKSDLDKAQIANNRSHLLKLITQYKALLNQLLAFSQQAPNRFVYT